MAESSEKDVASIGQHCSFQSCNLLDFLPIKCDLCLLTFCKEHAFITSHNCVKFNDRVVTDAGKNPLQYYECKFESCDQKELVAIECEFCKLNFCLKHRLPVDHVCSIKHEPIKSDKQSNTGEKKPEFKFEMKKEVSEKNAPLAAKLLLMKLRQTAVGPTGLTEQFKYYCYVEYKNEKKPFFFSTKWPGGKCVEFVTEKLKINEPGLGFFITDEQVNSSCTVEELIKNNVLSSPGLTLTLKSRVL